MGILTNLWDLDSGFCGLGFGGSGLEIPSTEATLLQYSSVRLSRDPRRTISESKGPLRSPTKHVSLFMRNGTNLLTAS